MKSASLIQTFSGILIDPINPDPSAINIVDIAHALSNQCRFTGHTREFYSVAEHSVHVAELVEPRLKLHALLHDASEAYLSDIARPVKHSLKLDSYRKVEKRLQGAVYAAFGLDKKEPEAVKWADDTMLAIEARDLMGATYDDENGYWDKVLPLYAGHVLRIRRPWSPKKAEQKFLDAFYVLEKEAK